MAFGYEIFFPVGVLGAEYSYRQSNSAWMKCKPATFLHNGNGNNSSQHLENTFYMLCIHYLI